MNCKLNLELIKEKWYDLKGENGEDFSLKIRPYPASKQNMVMRRSEDQDKTEFIVVGEDQKKMFCYCLTDAKGLKDGNDNPLALTEQIKGFIYDNEEILQTGIKNFVLSTVQGVKQKQEEIEKNLQSLPPGTGSEIK